MSQDSLGDRMKMFEDSWRLYLPRRMPTIIRVDIRAAHTLTKNCKKPFDESFISCMNNTAIALCEEIQGACMAYIQSDEISVLVNDYKKFGSQSWFDKNIQKITSISASVASVAFTLAWNLPDSLPTAVHFDSRAFILPEREVNNYMLWRQKDWERNSIQMLTRAYYSHKEMANKKVPDMHEMLHAKGVNWNDLPIRHRRGRCAYKGANGWAIDNEIPIFSQDSYYVEQHLQPEEQ